MLNRAHESNGKIEAAGALACTNLKAENRPAWVLGRQMPIGRDSMSTTSTSPVPATFYSILGIHPQIRADGETSSPLGRAVAPRHEFCALPLVESGAISANKNQMSLEMRPDLSPREPFVKIVPAASVLR